jgi:deoxycytidylate deaminase
MKEGELIEIARKMALRSPVRRFQTGAIIVRNNKIISAGWSHASETNMACYRSMHAEHHAITRCDSSQLADSTIVIVTVSRKSGNMTDATPCIFCMQNIQRVSIKEIITTTSGGGIRAYGSNSFDKDMISESCQNMRNLGKRKAYIGEAVFL